MTFEGVLPPRPPPAPPAGKMDPEAALDLATRDFLAGGRLDMRSIAARLNVGRTTLYRWFGDRESLMAALLARLAPPMLDALWARCDGEGPGRLVTMTGAMVTGNVLFEPMRRLVEDELAFAMRVLMSYDNALFHAVRDWYAARLDELGLPGELAVPIVTIVRAHSWARPAGAGRSEVAAAQAGVAALVGVTTPPTSPFPASARACAAEGLVLVDERILTDGTYQLTVTADQHHPSPSSALVRALATLFDPIQSLHRSSPTRYECTTGPDGGASRRTVRAELVPPQQSGTL